MIALACAPTRIYNTVEKKVKKNEQKKREKRKERSSKGKEKRKRRDSEAIAKR